MALFMKVTVFALFTLCLWAPIVSANEFKVASFDVRRIFNEWKYSIESQKKIEDKREELEEENNARLATINNLQMQRTKLHRDYRKNAASMTAEQKKEMDMKFRGLGRDAMALEQDRRDFFDKGRRELGNEITTEANLILDRITQAAQVYALEKKFAMVVETGGHTTSNTPFFLHLDGVVDITDELIKRLNAKDK